MTLTVTQHGNANAKWPMDQTMPPMVIVADVLEYLYSTCSKADCLKDERLLEVTSWQ